MTIELWTEEFFIELLERKVKNEISMYFYVHHDRNPSKEEYEQFFDRWKSSLKCIVNNYDLGTLE